MHIYMIPEDTEGLVISLKTGEEQEWSTRKPLEFTDEDLVFDRVRMSNGQVLASDWGRQLGRVQRWCEECRMGFKKGDYILVIKEKFVATYA